jgi:hypothetical protein
MNLKGCGMRRSLTLIKLGLLLLSFGGAIASSVRRLATAWAVLSSNPRGCKGLLLRYMRADRRGVLPSSCKMGRGVFPGRERVALITDPHVAPRFLMGRAVPLPTLCASTGMLQCDLYLYHALRLDGLGKAVKYLSYYSRPLAYTPVSSPVLCSWLRHSCVGVSELSYQKEVEESVNGCVFKLKRNDTHIGVKYFCFVSYFTN